MEVILPDGSKVWLSAHSIFKYPKVFLGKTRQVELVEGRAFFDVKHQSDHPFIVKTESLNITVLGTSFDVSANQKEGTTKVSVVSGKVGVTFNGKRNQHAIMLLPKQQIVLSNANNQIKKEPAQEAVVNLWCKSPLVFEQENLNNIFKALEKQYNTRITVDNKQLLDERISITLSNQHLDTIMAILSFTKHFKYQIANDSTVVIK
jgi:ferric-dicitrate binding protein FerR (iron transport regulator)